MRSPGVLHSDTRILVPFFDIDTMNVVWHGHYVKYLEVARCALLDNRPQLHGNARIRAMRGR
jgi:acyl-CoA thioester hydrolase